MARKMDSPPGYLSVPEYARRHRVKQTQVYSWLNYGHLPYTRVTGRIFIPEGAKRKPLKRRPTR